MASESKSFISAVPLGEASPRVQLRERTALIEIGLVYGLILVAVWTPQGRLNRYVCLAAALATVGLSLRGCYSPSELGLNRPLSGAVVTLAAGVLLVGVIASLGLLLKSLGPPQPLPWLRAWQYGVWSLLQQFILESFMYVRLESLYGSRRAVLVAAFLFAVAHIPSPVLTMLSFLGALFFCEMFRRYRNIYALGVVHAALGLTIAASLPDSLMHHMRVGLGFLTYHP
jgi:membrane protease YdiL (CAAX protease family)